MPLRTRAYLKANVTVPELLDLACRLAERLGAPTIDRAPFDPVLAAVAAAATADGAAARVGPVIFAYVRSEIRGRDDVIQTSNVELFVEMGAMRTTFGVLGVHYVEVASNEPRAVLDALASLTAIIVTPAPTRPSWRHEITLPDEWNTRGRALWDADIEWNGLRFHELAAGGVFIVGVDHAFGPWPVPRLSGASAVDTVPIGAAIDPAALFEAVTGTAPTQELDEPVAPGATRLHDLPVLDTHAYRLRAGPWVLRGARGTFEPRPGEGASLTRRRFSSTKRDCPSA